MVASDVFVFPSYREGFPNVVMQAACLEVPVIASDINGCNEILEHNNTGILVPVKDAKALANAMLSLASENEGRIAMRKKARTFVVQNFDRQYVWNELLREYHRHLERINFVSR